MQNGVDIVQISRFEKLLQNDSFLKKYFNKIEWEYISQKNNKTETVSGLYAIKEAVLKSLGIGIGNGLDLKEIVINHDVNGAPFVEIDAKMQYYLSLKGCSNISVSTSHDGDYTVAFCVIN